MVYTYHFLPLFKRIMEVFRDDFSVYGGTFDLGLENLAKVLHRCEEVHLVLNWERYHFIVQEDAVLGRVVSHRGIEVDKAKIEVIQCLRPPACIKGVRSYLGYRGFYHYFIEDFSEIAKPLTLLLANDTLFAFISKCLKAF